MSAFLTTLTPAQAAFGALLEHVGIDGASTLLVTALERIVQRRHRAEHSEPATPEPTTQLTLSVQFSHCQFNNDCTIMAKPAPAAPATPQGLLLGSVAVAAASAALFVVLVSRRPPVRVPAADLHAPCASA